MDEEKPLDEHVAERRTYSAGFGPQQGSRRSKAAIRIDDGRRHASVLSFLDRRTSIAIATQEEEISLAWLAALACRQRPTANW